MERIAILLNDRSYEYDIYTLVIALYQGVRTQVFDPGNLPSPWTGLVIETWVHPSSVSIDIFQAKIEPGEEAGTATEQCQEPGKEMVRRQEVDTEAVQCLEDVDGTEAVQCLEDVDSTATAQCQEDGMATAQKDDSYRTGRHEGPGSAAPAGRMIPLPSGADRSVVKNRIKRNLYEMLRQLTGRDLPWGNLTGIRPVKLAMQFLEEGDPDARRRMQERYYVSPGKADLAVRIAEREKKILSGIDAANGYSLYIGIPFCPSICLYCSFSSSPIGLWEERTGEYLDALLHEMRACRGRFPGKTLHTVYIGGGTPTTLSPGQLDRLLGAVEENFDLSQVMEFTVEAGRPDSITRQKLEALRRHPVTRISVNPQTMNQKTLDLIGRRHTVEDTVRAFEMARELGFDNINMDLIVGLPGEGPEEVEHTMQRIEALDPDDVTVHALALKRAARLALHMEEYEKISFHASDRIMERCEEGCRRLGMTPYYLYRQKNMAGNFENVGYAKPGKAGIYNILIMEEVECILALGASGSTKIVYGDGRIERIENVKDIRNYLERIDEMIDRKMKEEPGNG